jgi:hypothetical protein
MCLDGALVRRLGAAAVRAAVAEGFEETASAMRRAVEAHHFAHADDAEGHRDEVHARMGWLCEELSRGPWIEGYGRPDGLVRGLAGMRRRFGLPPFAEDERARLTDAVASLAGRADAALDEILAASPGAAAR